MNKKMTKKDYYNLLLEMSEVNANPALLVFINHEIELLSRKNSTADRKPTVKQAENENIKQIILNGMEDNRIYTVTEIIKEIEGCDHLSNQHTSALLRQLVIAEKVVRIEEKRKAYFQKA